MTHVIDSHCQVSFNPTHFCRILIAIMFMYTGFLKPVKAEVVADTTSLPQLGLTLSGGGAKGLAHIGTLHILDSLNIRPDYITGTSMGSIVGGLYASGYTAAEIEDIALRVNWQDVFSPRADLLYTHPRKREAYGRFILELPIENWSFVFPSGAIEGQQMWNLLSELFFHVRNIDDFRELPIPFACVATDLSTGEAVIMNSGDIVTALRASMSMPSVFTTVKYEGRQLIDGGVALNFPVAVVKEMGADFVVGSNVSQGLRKADDLRSPIDIIYQMGFFLDARSFEENRKLTDVFVEPKLDEFTAASFQDVEKIIERGKQAARLQIDALLELKKNFPQQKPELLPDSRDIYSKTYLLDNIRFEGLNNIREWFVRNAINMQPGDTLTIRRINSSINRLFATGYFNKINYLIEPVKDSNKAELVYYFDERPFGRAGGAIHYSSFTGVGLIGNLATNKLFFYNTSAYLKALLGEKPAIKGGIDFFLSDRHNNWLNLEGLAKYLIFPVYEDFRMVGEYKQSYLRTELSFNYLTGDNSYFTSGLAWYYQSLSPNMRTDYSVRGYTQANELFVHWKHNSLNRLAFPQSGTRTELKSTFFFNQRPSLSFRDPDGNISTDLAEAGIIINNYLQIYANWESYLRVSPKFSSFNQLQAGYSFYYEQDFINTFNLGGTYSFLKNQMVFAGLNEYEVISENILAYSMGWQYNIWDEFMLTPLFNAALYDFKVEYLYEINRDNLVLGAGLNIGYFSAVGPLEVTFAYSPQTRKVLAYINLGWTF